MNNVPCEEFVLSLRGQYMGFTGTVRVNGEHQTRDHLVPAVQARAASTIPAGSRSRKMTLLVVGYLGDNVVDILNNRSKTLRYVIEERERGNHICIVDDAGISALLGGEAAPCVNYERMSTRHVRALPHSTLRANQQPRWDKVRGGD